MGKPKVPTIEDEFSRVRDELKDTWDKFNLASDPHLIDLLINKINFLKSELDYLILVARNK